MGNVWGCALDVVNPSLVHVLLCRMDLNYVMHFIYVTPSMLLFLWDRVVNSDEWIMSMIYSYLTDGTC